jgi:serine/threonine-protein kinase
MLMKHISEPPRPLGELRRDVPRWLALVLTTALAKKPAERFTSALAFRDALAARREPAPDPGASSAGRASSAWKHAVPPSEVLSDLRRRAADRAVPARLPSEPPRDAVEAANGYRGPATGGGNPPVPQWMPASWRDTRAQWQEGAVARRGRNRGDMPLETYDRLPVLEKIRIFRRRFTNAAITVAMLALINIMFSPGFLWFLFPAIGMGIGLLRRWGSLHDDGVRWKDVYGAETQRRLAEAARQPSRALPGRVIDPAESLAPPDILAGPHGQAIRRAATDRESIREAVSKLGKADRELIPDVLPTVDGLVERAVSVASALHRIDEDVRPGVLEDLAQRIAALRTQPESRDRDQKLQLLERQHTTLADLQSRRETLVAQLENASLMLQSMRVDLIALRSAGVQAAINDVSGATQEAQAISRDIANVLDAARQVRN